MAQSSKSPAIDCVVLTSGTEDIRKISQRITESPACWEIKCMRKQCMDTNILILLTSIARTIATD